MGDMAVYTSPHTKFHPEARDNPLTLEETATFLSDSSIDTAPLLFKAEEEEEENLLSDNAHRRRIERRLEDRSKHIKQLGEYSNKTNENEAEEQDTINNTYHSSEIRLNYKVEKRDMKQETV